MKNKNSYFKWFTLVELIIVITILSILSTIAFISFQWITKDARDWDRLTTSKSIEKWLELYSVKTSKYPIPDIKDWQTELLTWAIEIGWQEYEYSYLWEIWDNLSKILWISKTPKDPLTWNKYTYATTKDFKKYQVATILESDLVSLKIINQANASNFKAKVDWNHKIETLYNVWWSKYLVIIPSLIFDSTKPQPNNILNSSWTYFVVNNQSNLPYSPNNESLNLINTKNWDEQIKELRWNNDASIITINIDSIFDWTYSDVNEWLNEQSNSWEILASLWAYNTNTTFPAIWWSVTWQCPWEKWWTTANCSANRNSYNWAWWNYTLWNSFIYKWLTFYVQLITANGYIAYTKANSWSLTIDDYIWIFENTTDSNNRFVMRTINQWATEVYVYWNTYTNWRLWSEQVFNLYCTNTSSQCKDVYSEDKSILWDYYQWWRNDPISLIDTTTAKYTWDFLIWWINLSWTNFITNSWWTWTWLQNWNTNYYNWTDNNKSWPCSNWYRLPTWWSSWEWLKITDILTWKNWTYDTSDNILFYRWLRMPLAWFRNLDWTYSNQWYMWFYWSSTPHPSAESWLVFAFMWPWPSPNNANWSWYGDSVRCIKN